MYTENEINSATDRIFKKFDAHKVFLFGSYATGKQTPDSDLDLCIITNLDGKRKLDLMRAIRREISSILKGSLDILLYSEKEFAQRANLKNTLEYKILNEGILISG